MTAMHVQTARTTPLGKLWIEHTNWSNPREFTGLDDADIADLGKSIKANGIVTPILVQKILMNGETVDLVIDGQRRYLAAKEVLAKTAEIPVVDLTAEAIELTAEAADELLLKALITRDREDLSDYELSTIAQRMKDRGKPLAYIGGAVGHDGSWVSKILKARATATPKLMLRWRKGEITTEQFKDLAEVKDHAEQEQKTKEVVEARKSGDLAEARTRAKEVKEAARAKAPPKINGKAHKPAVAGPQLDLIEKDKAPAAPKPPSKIALLEMLDLAKHRPPTSDYVKGLMHGVSYSQGTMDPSEFSKAWREYISRIEGKPKKVKAKAPGKKANPSRARKPTKAKAKKARKAKK